MPTPWPGSATCRAGASRRGEGGSTRTRDRVARPGILPVRAVGERPVSDPKPETKGVERRDGMDLAREDDARDPCAGGSVGEAAARLVDDLAGPLPGR